MKSYVVKTPSILKWMYPKRIWAFSRKEQAIYLTFDDGPIPEVTPWVLEQLKAHDAKATFFCIGDNIRKHPDLYRRIIAEGHAVGNHTFHHLKGTETDVVRYLEDIEACENEMLKQVQHDEQHGNKLFRPPYGRMTSAQAKGLRHKGYQIALWDVLSADFDTSISEEKCLQNVLRNLQNGSVVIFHDSLKAQKNLRYVLPKVLDFITTKGYAPQAMP